MAKKSSSFFPKSLTTVTPFTRMLALSMLIVFPIIAFFLGVLFERVRIETFFLEQQYIQRMQTPRS